MRKNNNIKRINETFVALVGFLTLTMTSGLVLSSTLVSADDVVDNVVITIPTSCTMSGSGMTSHTANLHNGSYTPNIGTTTMSVFCNDTNGFAIYAIGFSGDELGTEDSTKLLGTNASNNAKIVTGTATSAGDPDVSNWAMKLSTDSEATYPVALQNGFDSYHVVPSEYTQVAIRTAGTDVGQNATGSILTSTYAAYISRTQPADTYSGKVKYVLVHPNDAPAPTPPSPFETCDTPVPNLTYMQDLNSSNKASILANMTEDAQYFLKDKRDEKSYCVAKLKDGNIWMTQNLDHDIKTDGSVAYTPATTDVPETWTPSTATYPTGTTTWNQSATAPESYDPGALYVNSSYINGMPLAQAYVQSCQSGTCDQSIYEQLPSDWKAFIDTCDATFQQCDMSKMPSPSTTTSIDSQHNHLGNYYNWTAAIAMNDSSSYTTQYQDVNQSICPANWTLPKNGNVTTSGSFQYLVTQYGWDSEKNMMVNPRIWNSPIKASLSGYWLGSLDTVGLYGDFWSPVMYYGGSSYSLATTSNGVVYPNAPNYSGRGFSVRCVARW